MRKWKSGGPAGPPEPVRFDDTPELLQEFEANGVLTVASPDGKGNYTFLSGKKNIKGYPMTMYWDGKEHGGTVHYYDYAHPKYGGEVAYWFEKNNSYERGVYHSYAILPSQNQTALVAVILGFIKAGKRIYANNCGDVMSVEKGL